MDGTYEEHDRLIIRAARTLKGYERRRYIAEVTLRLCDGSPRKSEERFGWGRATPGIVENPPGLDRFI